MKTTLLSLIAVLSLGLVGCSNMGTEPTETPTPEEPVKTPSETPSPAETKVSVHSSHHTPPGIS